MFVTISNVNLFTINPFHILILLSLFFLLVTIYTIWKLRDEDILLMREYLYPLSGDNVDYRALREIVIEDREREFEVEAEAEHKNKKKIH